MAVSLKYCKQDDEVATSAWETTFLTNQYETPGCHSGEKLFKVMDMHAYPRSKPMARPLGHLISIQ
jgi:hypothetical protein